MAGHEEWDHLFTPSRRELRRERKIAKRTDRSKYKISDRGKQASHPTPKNISAEGVQGRVTCVRSQGIDVTAEGKTYTCSLKGSCKLDRTLAKNLVVVGDNVLFEITGPADGSIHRICPRSSSLCREEHLHRIKQQLVAANVDIVLITVSLAEPSLRPSIIDRYLLAAEKGNIRPVILINKIDLRDQYLEEAALADECLRLYPSLGITTVALSTRTGEGMAQVKELLRDKISVLSGQSGTGKSCIINALTGLSLKTGSIRAVGKGSHTTTSTTLIPLPSGGWCIDTPGIRSFGVYDLQKEDLRLIFKELFAEPCAFSNCWHIGEHGCVVPKGVEDGKISPLRLRSYLSLLAAAKPQGGRP